MKQKRLASAGVAGALLVALLTGCGSSTTTGAATPGSTEAETETKVERTLVWGATVDVTSWSVNDSEYGNRAIFYQAAYDNLIVASPDGTLVPGVATEWSYDDSLTVLTLTVESGLTFTDGTALDAQAVVDNLNRFATGASPDASLLASMAEAIALDATTVQITLSDVDPAFLGYLSRNPGMIQSPASFDTADEDASPIGSGPYIFNSERSVAGSEYHFDANPDFRNADDVQFSTLVIKVIEDATAMVNALKAGQVDLANLQNADAVEELEASGLVYLPVLLDWAGFTFVDRSGALGSPFEDVRVRQAVNYGINRDALLAGIQSGRGEVRQQVFNEKSLGYDESLNSFYSYDVAKAKELLAEAGYPNGFTVDLPAVSGFFGEATYALMAQELANIGITVNHVEIPDNFFGEILAPNYPAFYMTLERSANDWQFLNFLVAETGVFNPEGYSSAESADLIAQIRVASDAERGPLLKQLNRYLVEQAWFAPFYAREGSVMHKPELNVVAQAGNIIPSLFNVTPNE